MLFCGETEVLFLDIFSGPPPLPRSPAPPHRLVYLTLLKAREKRWDREREKREKKERESEK